MDLGAILLLLGVLVIIVIFVTQPFTDHRRVKAHSSPELSSLLAERERAFTAMQELEFDYGLGKVPLEEYSAQRASLLQKGSDVLRQLDEIQSVQVDPAEKSDEPLAESSARRLSDEDLEDLIAKRRTIRLRKTAGFCPACGKPIMQSDQFCPSCGQMVNSE